MSKHAIRKDFRVEIKKSISRFLSIFCIVALGVAFFSGIRSAEPDMRISYDEYFDEQNLSDITIISTMGLTQEDLDAVDQMKEVSLVQGENTADFLCNKGGNDMVIQVMTMPDTLNKPVLESGKWAKNSDECVMDLAFAKTRDYQIGDTILLTLNSKDKDVTDTLCTDEFKITGFVSSPLFITFGRGSSSLGQGEINGFILVNKNSFHTDYFTRMSVSVEGAKEKTSFTHSYDSAMEDTANQIEDRIAKQQCEKRYAEIKKDAQDELDNGQKKIDDAIEKMQRELKKAKTELEDGQTKILDAKKEIQTKEQDLKNGKEQLEQKKRELNSAREKLYAAQNKLEAGEKKLKEGFAQYESGKARYDAACEQLKLAMENPEYVPDEAFLTQLEIQKRTLEQTKITLDQKNIAFKQSKKKLETSINQVNSGFNTIHEKESEIEKGKKEIQKGKNKLKKKQKELDQGFLDYKKEKEKAEEKIAKEQKKIEEGTQDLLAVKLPKWHVLLREFNPGYTECGENADRIAAIGKVFPIIFFLVAALISLTTMTRMVDEQRTLIGTYKALGYSKFSIAGKYIWYALLATFFGSFAGIFIGEKIIPGVIIEAYRIMYPYIPNVLIPYQWSYGLFATFASLICTIGATAIACYRELSSAPANLMRPVPPVTGKRILLERATIIWKRISFSQKATLRNLFRYKKRFFMTILGIGGCMALIVVGFGLRDSITKIADIQFDEIQKYDAMILTSEDEKDALNNVDSILEQSSEVEQYTNVFFNAVNTSGKDYTTEAYLYVPEDPAQQKDFTVLRTRVGKKKIKLEDNGVVISEKLAKLMDVKVGDSITIHYNEKDVQVPITAITEMYLRHYIYMTPTLYKAVFHEEPQMHTILYKGKEGVDYKKIGESLLTMDQVQNVSYLETSREQLSHMLGSLDLVIVVLITAAGLLAFVVLYNLNNINIEERKRELASIKVLGFYNGELAAYVYRENILLTLIGMAFGLLFGKYLLRFIIVTVEVENCMFGRSINGSSYLISLLLTLLFSILVNLVMYIKIKNIDMIESLKSVE
ncbi:MAG: FtsX-like permease family protein [Lachnospiraceae bacterium]